MKRLNAQKINQSVKNKNKKLAQNVNLISTQINKEIANKIKYNIVFYKIIMIFAIHVIKIIF